MEAETAKQQDIPELTSSDSESESDGEKGKNGHESDYKELLIEAKEYSRLTESKLLKRDSKDPHDAVDKLYRLYERQKTAMLK